MYVEHLFNQSCKKIELSITDCFDPIWTSECELIAQTKEFSKKKPSGICHIIAGGASATESISTIKSEDFVIGFNFAAVAQLHFDLYFIEIASDITNKRGLSILQSELVNKIAYDRISATIAKNFWEGKVDINVLKRDYGSRVNLIRDAHLAFDLPIEKYPTLAKALAKSLLRPRNTWMAQYGGTALTCIQIASKLGFNRIVVHGLDFGGAYFYQDFGSHLPQKYREALYQIYPKVPKQTPHLTGNAIRTMLPYLRDELNTMGIELLCASEKSPSSEILATFTE